MGTTGDTTIRCRQGRPCATAGISHMRVTPSHCIDGCRETLSVHYIEDTIDIIISQLYHSRPFQGDGECRRASSSTSPSSMATSGSNIWWRHLARPRLHDN